MEISLRLLLTDCQGVDSAACSISRCLLHLTLAPDVAGEKAVEALASYERSTISMFKTAASKLIQEVGSPEDAVAMALAKITGLSTLKVSKQCMHMTASAGFGAQHSRLMSMTFRISVR